MAGSRLQKYGTVFTRVRDLMRAGVIKETEKPLWFDVYAAFPPSREPLYVKPVRIGRRHVKDPVPDILYEEDQIRAKFFELYGSGPKAFDLTNTKFVSTCQRFVEMYSRLASRGEVEAELLLEQTGKALLAEGIVLRGRGRPAVAARTRNPVLDMKLADMLTDTAVTTSASEELPQTVNADSSTAS